MQTEIKENPKRIGNGWWTAQENEKTEEAIKSIGKNLNLYIESSSFLTQKSNNNC